MNFERFIAQHISSGKSDNYAKPVVRISYISIALGLALMIISVAVVIGFKHSISNKIIGFTSDLKIVPFDNNESLEENPVDVNDDLIRALKSDPNVSHIQLCARKAGVIKTEDQIQGVVFKGVGVEYDKTFLESCLVEGKFPDLVNDVSNDVLISKSLADKLKLKTGDDLRTWFIGENNSNARGRKFRISGLYNTSMQEFDNVFVIGDIRHVQKLNGWDSTQVGSIELSINERKNLKEIAFGLNELIPFNLTVVTVEDEYPQIFNWLDLLDTNVIVILILLIIVASITMISTLLVLIIERTNMVGILKAMGANNGSIRKIFLYKAGSIILKGILWGDVMGLAFMVIQFYFRVIKLSPENYYVSYVPVEMNWIYFILLNIGAFLICSLMLIAPSYYITRIIPARALRYE